MKKWYKICGLVSIFLTFSLFSIAQDVVNKHLTIKPAPFFLYQKSTPRFPKLLLAPQNFVDYKKNISLNITPSTATQSFGFFCRAELKTDAALKVPIRFRLGSLPYCDYMEGKTRMYK